jgi:hypothetical protein
MRAVQAEGILAFAAYPLGSNPAAAEALAVLPAMSGMLGFQTERALSGYLYLSLKTAPFSTSLQLFIKQIVFKSYCAGIVITINLQAETARIICPVDVFLNNLFNLNINKKIQTTASGI